ncbi:MAG: hypothetical protein K9M36_02475 [Candidatus Pacebacteria bacterium]|nr:hypothetical protein [Candidatus Paceibacterota bacterium]
MDRLEISARHYERCADFYALLCKCCFSFSFTSQEIVDIKTILRLMRFVDYEYDTMSHPARTQFGENLIHFMKSGEYVGLPESLRKLCSDARKIYLHKGAHEKIASLLPVWFSCTEAISRTVDIKEYIYLRKKEGVISMQFIDCALSLDKNVQKKMTQFAILGTLVDSFFDIYGDYKRGEILLATKWNTHMQIGVSCFRYISDCCILVARNPKLVKESFLFVVWVWNGGPDPKKSTPQV